jgi:predicted ATP-binding protein involved in virulence
MRITEISVSRLFGIFDHSVSLSRSERVTIIHGPNGYGKTTLLRLVHDFVGGRYSAIRKVPFRDFQLTFDTGQVLEIVRIDSRPQGREYVGPSLTITLRRGEKAEQKANLPAMPTESLQYVDRFIPHVTRISSTQWRDDATGEVLDVEEVLNTYGQYLPPGALERYGGANEQTWLREFRNSLPVRFIESQRLLQVRKGRNRREESEPVRPAVIVYAQELATLIQAKLAEYATLSQSLDRSFPKRLVDQARSRSKRRVSIEALRKRLQQLEVKRATLTDAGLLDKEPEQFDLASYLSEPTTESVLPVYAEDTEQKLTVFNDLAPKIELLRDIVKAHFQYKEISISKEKGFEFTTKYPGSAQTRPLPPANLSSGEQHMLVLLYEMLFKVAPNSLIMIDEPEISLHVAWQMEFLRDIQRITELTGIDVLIATHAPAIINDRMDLTVSLEAPEAR